KTAINQALTGWPEGVQSVVLARSDHFADALAGVPLAASVDGPILLTPSATLDSQVEEAIKNLNPEKIYLLGGEGALSLDVAARLTELGWSGERLYRVEGQNRYDTAAKIATMVAQLENKGTLDAVAIATGGNFPDAL